MVQASACLPHCKCRCPGPDFHDLVTCYRPIAAIGAEDGSRQLGLISGTWTTACATNLMFGVVVAPGLEVAVAHIIFIRYLSRRGCAAPWTDCRLFPSLLVLHGERRGGAELGPPLCTVPLWRVLPASVAIHPHEVCSRGFFMIYRWPSLLAWPAHTVILARAVHCVVASHRHR
jgi:hypothetical protein